MHGILTTFIYLSNKKMHESTPAKEYRRLLTYSRLACMSQLYSFGEEGVPYRDLKAEFGLEDNLLGPSCYGSKATNTSGQKKRA